MQNPAFIDRELEIMGAIDHPNCVKLRDTFKITARHTYLHIVMDYVPSSLHDVMNEYRTKNTYMPSVWVKVYAFQMFSGLAYLHDLGLAHRDIKPENLLVNPNTKELKIADFGSAKYLRSNEKNTTYIATRGYRAPELLFDADTYTTAVDIWAAGCVLAELLNIGTPLFEGRHTSTQITEIIKIIGPPTQEDLEAAHAKQDYQNRMLCRADKGGSIEGAVPKNTGSDVLDLLKRIFVYNPGKRPSAVECMNHRCFDEIFKEEVWLKCVGTLVESLKLKRGVPE
jgi:glycogen synthase kinase 3 beta